MGPQTRSLFHSAAFWLPLLGSILILIVALFLADRYLGAERDRVEVKNAQQLSQAATNFRAYYSSEIVPLLRDAGVEVTHRFRDVPGSAPLPATLTIEMGSRLIGLEEGGRVNLFSDAPFAMRADRVLDSFERDALEALTREPLRPYFRFEDKNGVRTLRYAEAVVMEQTCVACHNTHPSSIKTDWRGGDVRGVQEIAVAVTSAGGLWSTGFAATLGFLLLATVASMSLVGAAMHRAGKAAASERAAAQRLYEQNLELEAAQAIAEETKARLEEAIEGLPDGFCYYDAEDRLVMCNTKYREIYADSLESIEIGRTFEEIIRHGIANGQYPEATGREEEWVQERLSKHRSGVGSVEQLLPGGRWLRIVERRTVTGGTVGFRVDISELKHRQEELRDSEGRLRAVVDSALDSVIAMDSSGNIVEFNPAAEECFGYRREEVLNKPMGDFIIPEQYREMHRIGLRRYLDTGQHNVLNQRIEIEAMRSSGEVFPVELAISPVEQEEGTVFVAYLRDITERQRSTQELENARAQAEAANQAKSEFLATVSHEIRTPMNGVVGMTNLLATTDLSREQRQWLETIRASSDSLLTLINDILDLSKLEARQLELEETEFSLSGVAESIVDLFWGASGDKGISLSQAVSPEVPEKVTGDPGRIRQILSNLVSNAVKFTDRGGVKIVVQSDREQLSARTGITIQVVDTGIGLDEEVRSTVFERFVQADADLNRHYQGTGLGLAICKELCDLMGGQVSVRENPGGGSVFEVRLPLRHTSPAAAAPADLTGKTAVLLAADPIQVACLSTTLNRLGIDGRVYPDLAAVRTAPRQMVDFCLVDSTITANPDSLRAILQAHDVKHLVLMTDARRTRPDAQDQEGWSAVLEHPIRAKTLARRLTEVVGDAARTRAGDSSRTVRESPVGQRRGLRILVAEDNRTNQMVARTMLTNAGHTVDVAANGEEAVNAVATFPYDAVLMDVQMPEMDGLEATRHIRAMTGRARDIPIVALTANVLKETRDKCVAAGMTEFLSKPYNIEDLQDALFRVTGGEADGSDRAEHPEEGSPSTDFDTHKLEILAAQLGAKRFTVILATFKDELTSLHREIVAGVHAGDHAAAERTAHQLKGAAANLGAVAVSQEALNVEQAASAGDGKGVGVALERLGPQVEAALASIDAFSGTLSSG